jgi:hypothetical protein
MTYEDRGTTERLMSLVHFLCDLCVLCGEILLFVVGDNKKR